VEEIEAWLWADDAIVRGLCGDKARAHPSPHRIQRPKELLQQRSRSESRRARYDPTDNPRLAEKLDLKLCAERCPAFRDLRTFVRDLFAG
jgi:hypothetical protein